MNQRILDETESQLQEARLSPSPVRQQRGQQSRFSNLTSIEQALGRIRSIAREEVGSQFLIKKLSEKNPKEISWILWEMKYELHELMIHYYGNQVVRKMFEVINERQRSIILNLITLDHRKFVDVCIHDIGYVEFSTNKYASNVVEDLFKFADQITVALMIQELMDSPNFLSVLQNPFGNYVVQRALEFSQGLDVHSTLWYKIMLNQMYLQSDPYGKRVLSFARASMPRLDF
ncbi:pumilio-like protein 12-like [Senna tora]|uniref:Pumilio-like protein 12-like n=1 Tax=Senna tora TaxID=362788 RepID=A0A834W5X4_9FABA|nr:pumilio-like protein 12-like [Senna tora]